MSDNVPDERTICEYPMSHNCEREALRQQVAQLQQENEALRNEAAKGIHTCHANCPRPMCVLRRENEALKDALFGLVGSSDGVYGLHLNGDPCPWEDLLEGGCLEEWLLPFGNPPHD